MNNSHPHLELPSGIREKLERFRRRVWILKLAEAALAGLFGLFASYLLVFAMDRFWDTPSGLRGVIFIGGAAALAIWLPRQWHRWVWQTRQLEQVARILRHTFPRLGDRLLGIVELVHSDLEQERSAELCRAALRQVDDDTRQRNFDDGVPNPRHRQWAWVTGGLLALALAVLWIVPAAGTNALARWLMPWRQIDRYTFAQLNRLPEQLVVPSAESYRLSAQLSDSTAWSPKRATARYDRQARIDVDRDPQQAYPFELPPQKEPGTLRIAVGDARKQVAIRPMARPELTSIHATIRLPDYLHYERELDKDVRSGALSTLAGSEVRFSAIATRKLVQAQLDDEPMAVNGAGFVTAPLRVDQPSQHHLIWEDQWGLSAKTPFGISINVVDDEPPTIYCTKLSQQQVVLHDEVLSFQAMAEDDFGVRRIGLQWRGVEHPVFNPRPAAGEKMVAAGGPEETLLEVTATLSAPLENIPPQTLEIRLFAQDYLPDREPIYSPTYVVHLLSAEDHAIWMTRQLQRWFRQAQRVHQREQQLLETNKDLRSLPIEEIDTFGNRRRIESQAAAEQANARRLSAVVGAGESLIQEALRNDQFNVATLEDWAQALQALKDIAAERMPSVADLLKAASQAPLGKVTNDPTSKPAAPHVGQNRDQQPGSGASPPKNSGRKPVPSITDVESGFNRLDQQPQDPSQSPPGAPRSTLPTTSIVGGGATDDSAAAACPARKVVDQAVDEQEDLLAQFAEVMDQLQKILGDLEGSTFVKRLKAASRRQIEVAKDVNRTLHRAFGVREDKLDGRDREDEKKIALREIAHSDNVYTIQEDLEAYFNRVQRGKYKTVLNEMRTAQVVGQLRRIAIAAQDNLSGSSISQAEFWADALDRWAEQLVGPGCPSGGT